MMRGSALIKYVQKKKQEYDKLKKYASKTGESIKGYWMKNIDSIRNKTKILKKQRKETTYKINKYYETKDYGKYINLSYRHNKKIPKQIIQNILKHAERNKFLIKVYTDQGNRKYPINFNTINFLTHLLSNRFIQEETNEISVSDKAELFKIHSINKVKFIKINRTKSRLEKAGKFFKYINTTEHDLSRYQIYNEKQINKIDNLDHCLFHTLKQHKINKKQLQNIITNFQNGAYIAKKNLHEIKNIIKKNIVLHSIDKRGKEKKQVFKYDDSKKNIDIAILEGHYFIYEKINKVSTLRFIYDLLNEFKPIEDYNLTKKLQDRATSKIKAQLNLNLIKPLNKKIKQEVKKNKQSSTTDIILEDKSNVFYADCESFVSNKTHELYMLGYVSDTNDNVIIQNTVDYLPEDVIKNFLDYITSSGENAIVYFHNVKYDFHILLPYLNVYSSVEKDNQYYAINIIYKGVKIQLKDSYKLVSMPLSKFSSNFALKEYNKKEAIAYKYYTRDNHNKPCNKKDYSKFLNDEHKRIFNENVKDEMFNPYDYYKEYLKLDCLVLKKGFKKFREIVYNEIDKRLDINEFLTVSSLTNNYLKINGCFEDVYPIQGVLRNYVAEAIRGGRVSVNEKYQKKVIEEKISDFDGVSLYPSAISRLCDEYGLPKGTSKRFTKNDLENWESKSYCILTVKINKVNKQQQMPFISYKDDKGILRYTNEPPKEDMIIDKYTLEDYINFHKIDYTIKDGVYWNNGFNKKMGVMIKNLFNLRLKNKKTNPALANILKLMLNSAYGKTILKQSFEKKVYMNRKKQDVLNNYIYNNYEIIKKIDYINEYTCMIKLNEFDDSFNYGHVGCSILSMSKRIMNEVFDTANENNINIYYTDTDSIHMPFDKINLLAEKYKETYDRELVGKNLGQFHNDFDLEGASDVIHATKSLFLGKKCYIDELESKNEKGETIKGYHFRMKGVSEEGLNHEVKTNKKFKNMFDLYKFLSSEKEGLDILLNPSDGLIDKKVMFEYVNNKVQTRDKFSRRIKF